MSFATFWISSLGPRATPTTNQLELILSNTASPQPPHPRTYTPRPRTSDSCTVHSRFANILPRHAKTQLYSIIPVHSNSLPPLSLLSLLSSPRILLHQLWRALSVISRLTNAHMVPLKPFIFTTTVFTTGK